MACSSRLMRGNIDCIIRNPLLAAKYKSGVLDYKRTAFSLLGVCIRFLCTYFFGRRYDMVLCGNGARIYHNDGASSESKKQLDFCTMEMCITGHSTDGKQHSQPVEKHKAFPHPANTVSHSSIIPASYTQSHSAYCYCEKYNPIHPLKREKIYGQKKSGSAPKG